MTQGELIPSLAEAQPGDLAFFDHADRDPKATNISHVGLLLSSTEIIHCSGYVHIDTIDERGIHLPNGELTHHLVQIKRYL
jgi:cell wall-associated NlpC family hydrolase